jgi:hypothetical protein
LVAKASLTRVTARPPATHAFAVIAIGTYEAFVERLAFRLSGAPADSKQPWKQ